LKAIVKPNWLLIKQVLRLIYYSYLGIRKEIQYMESFSLFFYYCRWSKSSPTLWSQIHWDGCWHWTQCWWTVGWRVEANQTSGWTSHNVHFWRKRLKKKIRTKTLQSSENATNSSRYYNQSMFTFKQTTSSGLRKFTYFVMYCMCVQCWCISWYVCPPHYLE
jgi:hypothetical protein